MNKFYDITKKYYKGGNGALVTSDEHLKNQLEFIIMQLQKGDITEFTVKLTKVK